VHLLVLTEFVIQFVMHRMNTTRVLVWFKYSPFVLHTEDWVLYMNIILGESKSQRKKKFQASMPRSEFHTAPLCRFCLVSTVWNTCVLCVLTERRQKCYVDCCHKNRWKIQKLHLHNHLISLLSTKHKKWEFQNKQWGPQKLVPFEVLTTVLLRILVLGLWLLVTWCVA
jgi:hypothetical protein